VVGLFTRDRSLGLATEMVGDDASGHGAEVRDCRKGAVREAAKFLFAPSDHAEGNVLEDTVVGRLSAN
jgi:hypothetical protein